MPAVSLRARWLLLLAALLAPAVLLLVSLWIAWTSTVAQLDERLDRTLDVAHEHARRIFQTADQTIATVAADFSALSDAGLSTLEAYANRRLAAIAKNAPEVEAVWIFDPRGRPVASSTIHPVPRDLDNGDRDYIRAHAAGDAGLFVGQNIAARIGDLTFFVVSRRRMANGVPEGVIALTLPPARIAPFYEAVAKGTAISVGIFRADGATLTRYPLPGAGLVRARTTAAFTDHVRGAPVEGRYRVVSGLDQTERLVTYKRVGDLPVYATAAMETSAYRSAFLERAMPLVLINLPLSLLLGFATWFAVSRSYALAAQTRRREEAEMALRHAQRLESLGQLTGGVAHDFNNLLAVVIGNMDLLAKRVTDPVARRLVETTRRAGERGASLTSRMLVFARRQQLREELVDVGALVESMTDLVERSIGGGHRLQVDAQPGLFAKVDASQLEVALLNLALNARDA
ncbi:MAG TPA: histidine kinase dimerization/phospho-acceptor domain-containing protein, partial [Beijerinckiaceae bacterium]